MECISIILNPKKAFLVIWETKDSCFIVLSLTTSLKLFNWVQVWNENDLLTLNHIQVVSSITIANAEGRMEGGGLSSQ